MLNHVISETNKYLNEINKDSRKINGQFFTSKNTAVFMAHLFNQPNKKDLNILDPCTGTGILSAST